MSHLLSILQEADPTTVKQSTPQAGRQIPPTNTPRPVQRPAPGTNGTPQSQSLKRKAEGQTDGGLAKIQRKDTLPLPERAILPTRTAPTPGGTKPKAATPSNAAPYRGTAVNGGLSAPRTADTIAKKPSLGARAPSASTKPASAPAPKAGAAASSVAPPAPTKKGSYAAMLAAAAQRNQAKPAAPPVKHEVPKFLKRKELEALKKAESAAAKGKKAGLVGSGRAAGITGEVNREKRKPVDIGYKGTIKQPTQTVKKPTEVGYRGTARPPTAPTGASSKSSRPITAKPKPRYGQARYGGYANTSEEDMDEEDEEDYDSDASSDMEAGALDVDMEEEEALKLAKREDAEALREENKHRAEKQARLAALAKAQGQKKRY